MADPEPAYPPGWNGPPDGERVAGSYVLLKGGTDLKITSGWETSVEFDKKIAMSGVAPCIATAKFKEFAKSAGKAKGLTMTLTDLKTCKEFIMHGGYITTYKLVKAATRRRRPKRRRQQ